MPRRPNAHRRAVHLLGRKMIAYLQGSGFLGTKAGLGSDLSLLIMLAAAVCTQRCGP